MSHTHKDQPGGHVSTYVSNDVGCAWNTPVAKRFAKKFHAREARREAKRITRIAMMEMESEREWLEQCRLDAMEELECDYEYMIEPYEEELERDYEYMIEPYEEERSKTDWLHDDDFELEWD